VIAPSFSGLGPCVHCGFCLPACPTYEATLDEADSPRGRIVLIRALERGAAAPHDEALVHHLDRCLACRACEGACPSGVSYGPAIEAARARVAVAVPPRAPVAAGLWLLARPGRQRLLWWASRAARATGMPALLARGAGAGAPALVRMLGMLAATRPAGRLPRSDGPSRHRSPAAGERTGRAAPAGAALVRPGSGARAGRPEGPRPSREPAAALFRG